MVKQKYDPNNVEPPSTVDDVETITRNTYDQIAAAYCEQTLRGRMRPIMLTAALEFETLLPRRSLILVLGAGDGRDAEIFIDKGHDCVLVDYSQSMLRLGGRRPPTAMRCAADIRSHELLLPEVERRQGSRVWK